MLFNSKNEDLNAEDVYQKLVTPVFGKGVAYDVPNEVSCFEQGGSIKNLSMPHMHRCLFSIVQVIFLSVTKISEACVPPMLI